MPNEPTSEWGKELKATVTEFKEDVSKSLRRLDEKVDAAQRIIDKLDDRINNPDVGIFKSLQRLADDSKAIPRLETGAKIIGTLTGAGIAILCVIGTNLFSVNARLGEFRGDIDSAKSAADDARKAADDVAAKSGQLATAISAVEASFKGMDQKLDQRLQQFDERLNTLGKKIDGLDRDFAPKQKLDDIQAKVARVDGKIDALRQAISGPFRRGHNLVERRLLRVEDRLPDARPGNIVFSLTLPEGIDPSLVEEVFASFPDAVLQRLGPDVRIVSLFDARMQRVIITLLGATGDAVQGLLAQGEGLAVSLTYVIRQP